MLLVDDMIDVTTYIDAQQYDNVMMVGWVLYEMVGAKFSLYQHQLQHSSFVSSQATTLVGDDVSLLHHTYASSIS
jgi:predicted P-loop ATPase